jgi:hypothetical protein
MRLTSKWHATPANLKTQFRRLSRRVSCTIKMPDMVSNVTLNIIGTVCGSPAVSDTNSTGGQTYARTRHAPPVTLSGRV